ncbi:MAG: tRNA (adenosine(37)-N6)-threonylcarbamoyltransferase complex ATPase subunit type 1 TsaE [Sedimentisphaerales bacterium]|jgi:tRNA threonylcarbamoyladenosine biosynthesis protein TsaE
MTVDVTTSSADETIEFGRKFGSQLKGGEVIALVGPLGAGKTHLIKGIVAGLGAEDAANKVTSPTFVLVNEYAGRLDIFHLDAYRLDSLAQFEQIGFDDYCHPGSVVLIEWADKIEKALAGINYIKIELSHLGQTARSIRVTGAPDYIHF